MQKKTDKKSRGFLSEQEYLAIVSAEKGNRDSLLKNSKPHFRTAGVRLIRKSNDNGYAPILCELLQSEKKLYTKIEICECLSESGAAALPFLIPLLGKIGRNQHTIPVLVDLDKKSFPLPRDIVARIIIRMGAPILPRLLEVLSTEDKSAIPEALDAIAHISSTSGDSSAAEILLDLYRKSADRLIKWKLIRAFQAFPLPAVRNALENILDDKNSDFILRKEAERSLARINQRSCKDSMAEFQDGDSLC